MNDDALMAVSVSIVRQACDDYLSCVRRIQRNQDIDASINRYMRQKRIETQEQAETVRKRELNNAKAQKDEIENFFKGEWFSMMSSANPDRLINRLNEISGTNRTLSMKPTKL